MDNKTATSYRLTPECLRAIAALSQRLGVNYTAVIELAVRTLAKKEKV